MDTIIPTEIDYKKYDYIHPIYHHSKLIQQTGGQTITLNAAGGQESIFELPVKTFNLAESYLDFTLTLPVGGGGIWNWVHCAGVPFFQQIQLYTRSGLFLCDLINAEHASNMIAPVETRFEDFITMDRNIGAAAAVGYNEGLRPNNAVIGAGQAAFINNPDRPNNTNPWVNYDEMTYGFQSAAAGNTALVVNYKIKLSHFKETILALNKDLYFNGEILLMRFVWNSGNKIGWTATAVDTPNNGPAAVVWAANSITNLTLYLAVEQNQMIVNDIMEKIKVSGLSLLVPFIHQNKASLNGTSQSVTLRYNRGHGLKLRKIFHSLYNAAEVLNTAYERTNIAGATTVTNYYTMLDNSRLQEFNVDCTAGDDWMIIKDKLKGSAVLSYNQFGYQWLHLEDFTHMRSPADLPMKPDEHNLLCGVDLNVERKWDFFGTTANANWIHYSFAVCDKLLTIGAQGISFV